MNSSRFRSAKGVFFLSLWFGLVSAVLQPVLYNPRMQNPDIPWLSVLLNLSLFSLIGILLSLSKAAFHNLHADLLVCFLCSTLVMFDLTGSPWLASSRPEYWAAVHHVSSWLGIISIVAGAAITFAATKGRWFEKTWRKSLPWLAVGAALYLIFVPVKEGMTERSETQKLPAVSAGSPNVIVIVVDALRADHLSSYGYDRATTPNFDKLGSEGVLFENAVAPAPWTVPAHASLLTGIYPHEHRTECIDCFLDDRFPTIGEAFMARGYRTAAFSANEYNFCRRVGLGRGFIHFPDYHTLLNGFAQTRYGILTKDVMNRMGRALVGLEKPSAARINEEAMAWIGQDKRPFLIFMNYMEVHGPYLPSPEYYHRYSTLPRLPKPVSLLEDGNKFSLQEVAAERDAYDGALSEVDSKFQSFMQELQAKGLTQNTIIVLLSDHGEGFDEHGLMGHMNSLYRELLHVPLIVWAPGRVPAGMRIAQPVSTAALPATLLDMIGAQNSGFRGPALSALWSDDKMHQVWPDPLSDLAQMSVNPSFPNYGGRMESVTTKQWHYIAGGNKGAQLFAYANDAAENNDLEDSPPGAATAASLAGELPLLGDKSIDLAGKKGPQSKNADAQRQKSNELLRSLGYTN